jgi:hypothetical protein
MPIIVHFWAFRKIVASSSFGPSNPRIFCVLCYSVFFVVLCCVTVFLLCIVSPLFLYCATLTEVFLYLFLSHKANARV